MTGNQPFQPVKQLDIRNCSTSKKTGLALFLRQGLQRYSACIFALAKWLKWGLSDGAENHRAAHFAAKMERYTSGRPDRIFKTFCCLEDAVPPKKN